MSDHFSEEDKRVAWQKAKQPDADLHTKEQGLSYRDLYGALIGWPDFGCPDSVLGWTIGDGVAVSFDNREGHKKRAG